MCAENKNGTKIKISKCDKTQKFKNRNVTKLKKSLILTKLNNSNCEKTLKLKL